MTTAMTGGLTTMMMTKERKFAIFFGTKLVASVYAKDELQAVEIAKKSYTGKWRDSYRVVELFGKGREP